MKKTLLFILSVVFTASAASAQIPNNDFESWTNMGAYSNPDGWASSNDVTASFGIYTVMKGTPGTSGSSYLKLVSKSVASIGVVPAFAISGKMNMTTKSVVSGFPYTTRSKSLTGKWQYMAYDNDQGFINVWLTKWNTKSKKRDTVAVAYKALPGMVMSWTSFSIDLNYISNDVPDTGFIILSASGASPAINSYLYVDNLAFAGTVAGINETKPEASTVNVYPNPATDGKLLISSTGSNTYFTRAQIFDMQGKEMIMISSTLGNGSAIDISALPKGQYVVLLSANDGIVRRKFIKQ